MRFEPKISSNPEYAHLLANHYTKPYGYYGYRPKGMKDWLLIYTVSGEGTAKLKNEILNCRTGDVLLFPPDTSHMYATAEEAVWELLWVHFQPFPEWNSLLQLPKTKEGLLYMNVVNLNDRERIQSAFQRLIHDSKYTDPVTIQLAFTALSEILQLIYRSHVQFGQKPFDDRIHQAMHFMRERISERISLNDIADSVGLSVSRLCHLYKEEIGETIIVTLTRMRLQKAAKLLQYTTYAVQEIAFDSGFDSPFYFSKKFAAQFGVTPTQFRKQKRQLSID